ncbi:putative phytanoyl-CoA dioxygenase [Leptomonas pyrrhocoris]|uniref:Putative phytanoyl-CoA dioxygenase n=1 Tax=Leptomonas pyrrhocoris TaxID=157538 RepID=A0A0M9G172_LEPPY|nr:putative phytanoyl-CoA dioxygenase [Leptomonas pyrrhocoris]KPA80255.1 putative phytanoyl-CoA dioxygenase [Leptomonas pyrrhocoris]|eukprot:XP_015658694.1 putative phytanoyl-CoA dioxygenase [Leptomonas pyrrhocoris]
MLAANAVTVKPIGAALSCADVEQFQNDGFLLHPESIFDGDTELSLKRIHAGLEAILNGEYETGIPPSNANALPADLPRDGRLSFDDAAPVLRPGAKPRTTIHLINAWRCNTTIAQLVTSPQLGVVVGRLMGWEKEGCRVAQDQVWIKPPSSGPLSFHRDTPYLDFVPKQVCTFWIPFDDISVPNVGALEYCRGSHRWLDGRRGSARQFYKPDYTALLRIAAQDEERVRSRSSCSSAPPVDVEVVNTHGCAGCCSFHNSNTWHGSGPNATNGWRRGIGIHYIRGDATFGEDCGKLWQQFRHADGTTVLPDVFFPRVALPS